MDRDEAEDFLSNHGWLSRLPAGMREDLLGGGKFAKFRKGEHVFSVRDDPRFLVGIASGTISAYVSYNPQEARLITVYGAGNWFGDAAVLSGNPHRGTAIARTDCSCLIISAHRVDEVASRYPEIWRWMAMNVLRQFDSYSTITEAALSRDPTSRVLMMFLSLRKLNPSMNDYDLSTEELGQMVGLTRNTVTKCLQGLALAGLVERGYANLKIPPIELLELELERRSAN